MTEPGGGPTGRLAAAWLALVRTGWRSWSRRLAALASGLLLAACFPPFDQPAGGWFALVPLLIALATAGRGEAARLGFGAGFVFWLVNLAWLLRLRDTASLPLPLIGLGWIALSAYCALYVAAFAFCGWWLLRRFGATRWYVNIALVLAIPVLWVGFEYLRTVVFTGFPWNPLGVSQYRHRTIIQVAEWTGAYGVSALLVLVNAGLALGILKHVGEARRNRYQPHPEIFVPLLALALVMRWGGAMDMRYAQRYGTVVIAAVQPAVPQVEKWSQEFVDGIYEKLRRLTRQAVEETDRRWGRKPDLIVWPETSVPDYVRTSEECRAFVNELLGLGVPILVGSMDAEGREPGVRLFNSALLFGAGGDIEESYDKQRLVPFGEYLPLENVVPGLSRLSPLGWSCTPGRSSTVFHLRSPAVPFSTPICFEDTMPEVARGFVLNGARLLVNLTNDAWFDVSAAPLQHLAHAVFRCVENRVPAVRATNSGMTAFIDRSGRVFTGDLSGDAGAVREGPAVPLLEGFEVSAVHVPPDDIRLTVYTRYGDRVFAIPSAVLAAACFLLALALRNPNTLSPTG